MRAGSASSEFPAEHEAANPRRATSPVVVRRIGRGTRRRGEPKGGAAIQDVGLPEQELFHRLGWLIRVRWIFLAGLGLAIATGKYVVAFRFPVGPTLAVGAAVLVCNVLFLARHRRLAQRPALDLASNRIEAGVQIALDLVALTFLIHLAGGIESPFIGFYVFHAIVGSMLLSNREALLVGIVAFGLFSGLVLLEVAGALPHHHVVGLLAACHHRQVHYLLAVSLAMLVTLFSSIAITSSIMNGLRLRERQLVLTQKALLKKSEDLEQAYATLTEKQKQLAQAEKQSSLGQLVAGIAHEINNPIQFIDGNMAILSEAFGDVLPILDDRQRASPGLRIARLEYPFFRKQLPVLLKDMSDGATRIGTIVRDLKTFARRDSGSLDEHIDLNEIVRASIRLLHNALKRLRVKDDLDATLPRIRGNLTQLQQVVVNTIQNAAEAVASRPQGLIRVRTHLEESGARVKLSIADNGTGIAPEVKDRMFDPFFTTKQRSGGTGLGLAITYGIVQQHQGEIQVETRLGEGTTFHFLLPVRRNGVP